jgi:hypothetical protein
MIGDCIVQFITACYPARHSTFPKIALGFLDITGGMALLGILTQGIVGLAPGELVLDETQWALWQIQVLIDATKLSPPMMWLARISAPVAAVAISGGFFGVAFVSAFCWLLYFGALSLVVALILTGVGLLRNLRTPT